MGVEPRRMLRARFRVPALHRLRDVNRQFSTAFTSGLSGRRRALASLTAISTMAVTVLVATPTWAAAPLITSFYASGIGPTTATLTATIQGNDADSSTDWYFCYGLTSSTDTCPDDTSAWGSIASGVSETASASYNLTGLSKNTKYYFSLTAMNGSGSYTEVGNFTTATNPTAVQQNLGTNPSYGPSAGGISVRVTGPSGTFPANAAAFTATGLYIRFGESGPTVANADISYVDSTKVTFTLPPTTTPGLVDVYVLTPSTPAAAGGSYAISNAWTYYDAPAFATSSALSPTSGPSDGGTSVTVSGSGFLCSGGQVTRDPIVKFGLNSGTVTACSTTSLTVTTPSQTAAGVQDVTVTNFDGQTVTAAGAFTYTVGAAHHLGVVWSPGSPRNGVAFSPQPVVTVYDANNEVVTDFTGEIAATSYLNSSGMASGTVSGTGDATATAGNTAHTTSGAVTFSGLQMSGVAGSTYYLRFSVYGDNTVTPVNSETFTLGSGPIAKLVFTTIPTAVSYGTAWGTTALKVTAYDANDNIVTTNSTDVIDLSTSGGTLIGTVSRTLNSGVATFNDISIVGAPGIFTLTATDSTPVTPISVTSSTIRLNTKPTVTVVPTTSSHVTDTTATLRADIVGNSTTGSTSVKFCYGTDPLMATCTEAFPAVGTIAASGTTLATRKSVDVSGLTSGTTYYYRIVAENDVGIVSQGYTTPDLTATFTTAPTITSVSPNHGTTLGSESVEITGSGFGASSADFDAKHLRVQFGETAADVGTLVTYISASKISVTTPAHASGTVNVYLLVGAAAGQTDAIATGTNVFTYIGAPTVTSALTSGGARDGTNKGLAAGGESVVITGTGFQQDPVLITPPTVTIAGVNATVTAFDVPNQRITVTLPAHAVGLVDVVVTNWDGQTSGSSGSSAFEYVHGAPDHLAIRWVDNSNNSASAVTSASNAKIFTGSSHPVIYVEDAYNQTVTSGTGSTSSIVVTVDSPAGATAGGTTTVTASGGVAAFTNLKLTGTSAATYTLKFDAADIGKSVTYNGIALTYGDASAIAISAGDGQSATVNTAVSTAPKVRVVDVSGNAVPGVSVTFAVASGGGKIDVGAGEVTSGSLTTDSSGYAQLTSWKLGTAAGTSNNTLTVTATGLSGSPLTFTATAIPDVATHLTMTSPTTAVNRGTIGTLTVTARDQFENVATAFGSQVSDVIVITKQSQPAGGGSISAGTTTSRATSGVATFSDLVISGKVGDYTLRATAATIGAGVTVDTSPAIRLTPGAATKLSITTHPTGAVNALALTGQPVVEALDPNDNVDTSYAGLVTASVVTRPSGGAETLSSATKTADQGVASFAGLTITGTSGSGYSLGFNANAVGGAAFAQVTSNTFSLGHGVITSLVVTSAPAVIYNKVTLGTMTVEARDVSNNLVTGFGGNVVVSEALPGTADGELLSGPASTNTVTAVGGVATFSAVKYQVLQRQNLNLDLSFSVVGDETVAAGSTQTVRPSGIVLYGGALNSLTYAAGPTRVRSGSTFDTDVVINAWDVDGLPADYFTGNVTVTVAPDDVPTSRLSGTKVRTAPAPQYASGFLYRGVVTFDDLKLTGPADDYVLSFTAPTDSGTTSVQSDTIRLDSAPVVTGFSPVRGLPGDVVTVSGLNFTSAGTPVVRIDGKVAAQVDGSLTAESVDVVVPEGATSGYISVSTDAGTGYSSALFSVDVPAPTINDQVLGGDDGDTFGVAPSSDYAGAQVTLTGRNLATATSIVWNGRPVTFVATATSLTVTIPTDATGTGSFTVTTLGGSVTSVGMFTVLRHGPSILSLSTLSGRVGSTVGVSGSYFINVTGVTVGGVAAVYSVDSASHITVTVPQTASVGAGFVVVATDVDAASSAFTVLAEPVASISGISSATGTAPASVTISGSNLDEATSVVWNGLALSFTVSGSALVAAIPVYALGSGAFTVVTPYGTVTSGGTFTVVPAAPLITSVTPTHAFPGETVTIRGTHLANVTSVAFHTGISSTVGAAVVFNSDTEVSVVVPPTANSGDISLVTAGGGDIIHFDVDVLVLALTDGGGSAYRGDTVTLVGENLDNVTSVAFPKAAGGWAQAVIVSNTSGSVTFVVPSAAVTGDISVVGEHGTGTWSAFEVLQAAPVITGLSVSHGLQGDEVTIVGRGFFDNGSASDGDAPASDVVEVALDGDPLDALTDYVVDDDGSITVVVPTGATSGLFSVSTTAGVATAPLVFTVDPFAPSISLVSPVGGAGVGSTVTVSGADFRSLTGVTFAGIPVSYSVVDTTELALVVPLGATDGTIVISGAFGTVESAVYDVVDPAISDVSPMAGAVGTSVTIAGSDFVDVREVLFNGTAATFSISSASTISAVVPVEATDGVITVVAPSGSDSSTAFDVLPPAPVVTGFSPVRGLPGDVVTVSGLNFTSAGTPVVRIDGKVAAQVDGSLTAESVDVVVPEGATSGYISVSTDAGTGYSSALFSVDVPAPTINDQVLGGDDGDTFGVAPSSDYAGAQVTLTGRNLATATSIVWNGRPVTFVATATSLTVTIPTDATGTGSFTVTTLGGSVTSVGMFTVLRHGPSILSLSTLSGRVGSTVGVSGSYFINVTGVTVGGVAAVYSVDSASHITVTVPQTASVGAGFVVVATDVDAASSAFTVLAEPVASISGISSATGTAPASVTISGSNLDEATSVVWNGLALSFTVSGSALVAAIPVYALGSGAFTVVTPYGTVTSGGTFTVVPAAPLITSVTPTHAFPGETVTIRGTHLANVTSVAFHTGISSTVGAAVVFNSDTEVSVVVPPTANSGDISLVTAGGGDIIHFDVDVLVLALTDGGGSAYRGDTVTLVGENLDNVTSVAFPKAAGGWAQAVIVSNTSGSVTFVVPSAAVTGDISVVGEHGTGTWSAFEVLQAAPVITGLSVSHGLQGDEVTIVGRGFFDNGSASDGDAPASDVVEVALDGDPLDALTDYVVDDDGSITVVVPTGATSGLFSVSTTAGVATAPLVFTVDPFAPSISLVSPVGGAGVGSTVTVSGADFRSLTGVTFAGIPVSYSVVDTTELALVVPLGATDGTIVISGAFGTVESAVYDVVDPAISDVSPMAGAVGTSVTIAGSDFVDVREVLFNGTAATFSISSASTISAVVPVEATDGVITVVAPSGSDSSTAFDVLPPAPVVTGFSPVRGLPGDVVTVSGLNFTSAGTPVVRIDGKVAAQVDGSLTAESVDVVVPEGATSGYISVSTDAGTGYSSALFSVDVPAPTINDQVLGGDDGDTFGVAPSSDYAGAQVTLTGRNLATATSIVWNGRPVTFVATATSLTVTIPTDATGTGSFTVTTLGGSVTSVGMFTVLRHGPSILSLSTLSGRVGSTVGVSGSYFINVTGVTVGGVAAVYSVDSASHITVTVPQTASVGAGFVVVATDVDAASSAFTVLAEPVASISGISSATGTAPASVTISGSNLDEATSVVWNGLALSFTVSGSALVAAIPVYALGSGAFTVVTPYGTVTSGGTFTVVPAAPLITSVTPTHAFPGETVTIRGTHLANVTSVAFHTGISSTVGAAVVFNSDTEVSVVVPPTANSGDISLVTAGGGDIIHFDVDVLVLALTDGGGSAYRGDTVTLVGENLDNVTSVAFPKAAGGWAQAVIVSNTSGSVTFVVPSAAVTGDISVVGEHGTGTWSAFEVLQAAPVITGLSVSHGLQGDEVTIVGRGFFDNGSASDGDAPASDVVEVALDGDPLDALTDYVVDDDGSITVVVPTGATSGLFSVSTTAGVATAPLVFTVDTFAPSISLVSPVSGKAGSTVTVSGSGFVGVTGVTVGGAAAVYSVDSVGVITVTVPGGAVLGDGDVVVSGVFGSDSAGFEVLTSAPSAVFVGVTGDGGDTVLITGANLAEAVSVSWNGRSLVFTASDTAISAVVPTDASGSGAFTVVTPYGAVTTVGVFTVATYPPSITGLSSSGELVPASVTISGANLAGVTSVVWNGYALSFTVVGGAVVADVPGYASGSGVFTVTTSAGVATSVDTFEALHDAPSISLVSPVSGKAGSTVTVSGSGFVGVTGVTVGGAAAVYSVDSVGVITVTVPGGAVLGDGDVVVSGVFGSDSAGFEVLTSAPSAVFVGVTGDGGDTVLITGANLAEAVSVSWNGRSLVFTASDTAISAVVPTDASGSGAFTVVTPYGAVTTVGVFTVATYPPSITGLSSSGELVPASVTISGANLAGVTSVVWNGYALSFTVVGGAVVADVPGYASGSGVFTVTTSAGVATSVDTFEALHDAPSISLVSPVSGKAGSTVTVSGSGFVGVTGVTVGGAAAVYSVDSVGVITVTVPGGAVLGDGDVVVSGVFGSDSAGFEVLTSAPSAVFVGVTGDGGDTVLITGANLAEAVSVSWNGRSLVFTASDTAISAVVPTDASGSGAFTVVTPYGAVTTVGVFTVATYPPSITGLSSSGELVPASVTISGANLAGVTSVVWNGYALSFTVVGGAVVADVPGYASGSGVFTVTTSAGVATSVDTFEALHDAPSISLVSPVSGKAGSTVTVSGSGFVGVTGVTVGGAAAVYSVDSVGVITVTVPGGAVLGDGDVVVSGVFGSDSAGFEVLTSAPSAVFVGVTGDGGDTVLITGANLAEAVSVSWNGRSLVFTASDTAISAVVPTDASGSGAFTVVTPYGAVTTVGVFTVATYPPSITGLSSSGELVPASVTISGANLAGVTSVVWNGYALSFTVVGGAVVADVPGYASGSGVFTVTTSAGVATSVDTFEALHDAPSISLVSPVGGAGVGSTVTVSGADFRSLTGVTFAGIPVSFTVVDTTELALVVPIGATDGTIVISGAFGTVESAVYDVVDPAISDVSPMAGAVGTSVTIAGSDFVDVREVLFNGTAATFSISSASTISAVVPVEATDGVITVVAPSGSDSGTAFDVLPPAPTVTSFTPTRGQVGQTVTLTGTHLDEVFQVFFNGVEAVVDDATSTTITVAVPAGATSGVLTVVTTGGTATSSGTFAVLPDTPFVASVTPSTAKVGDAVTVTGTNFIGVTNLTFNGRSALTWTVNSNTEITALVPLGATSGAIEVTNTGGTSSGGASLTVVTAPTISSFTPVSGPVGTPVTIRGTALSSATAVTFNGVPAVVDSNTDTEISTTVPDGATTGVIAVTTANGTAISASSFAVTIAAPTIAAQPTGVAPTTGVAGSTVTLRGTHLATTSNVAWNGRSVGFTATATTITVTIPSDAVGIGTFTVTTAGGSVTSAGTFEVTVAPPTISGFTPTVTPTGSLGSPYITVTGSGFQDAGGISVVTDVKVGAVSVGSSGADFTVDSATRITIKSVPAIAVTGSIVVVTTSGTATSGPSLGITPTIASVTASVDAGSDITIVGTGLAGTLSVVWNGRSLTSTSIAGAQVTAHIPSDAVGSGRVTLTTAGGSVTSSGTVTVYGTTPSISTFSPSATVTGAQSAPYVVVTGLGFANAAGTSLVTSVSIGGVSVGTAGTDFVVDSSTQITIKTVAATTATGRISVVTAGGTATSGTSLAITPTIASVTASVDAGTDVTVTGTGLTGTQSVTWNGRTLVVTSVAATSVTATMPNDASGAGRVTVTTAGGTVTSTGTSTVYPTSATVSGFTPLTATTGPQASPYIVVTGSGFQNAAGTSLVTAVRVGTVSVGVAATDFTVDSATQITVKTVPAAAVTAALTVVTSGGAAVSAQALGIVPTIAASGLSTTSAVAGSTVTVTGTGLAGATSVTWNGYVLGFIASATSVTVVIPSGAIGSGTFSVSTSAGTATSAQTFTVAAPPTITSVTPSSGAVGTVVTVYGTNLAGATAKVGATSMTSVSVAADGRSLTGTVAVGSVPGLVSVTTSNGTAYSAGEFTVTTPIPTISSIAPTSGQTGDTITITGNHLDLVTAYVASPLSSGVKFAGVSAAYTLTGTTSITATVPVGATTGKITFEYSGGVTTSVGDFVVVSTAPSVTSYTPTSGIPGTTVGLSGTNFKDALGATLVTAVSFVPASGSPASATYAVNSATQLTVTIPVVAAGAGTIRVTTSKGQASTGSFTIVGDHTISGFVPSTGTPGTTVTITGTNFTGVTAVAFNGTNAAFSLSSSTTIAAVVPTGASTGAITVTTTSKSVSSSPTLFTVLPFAPTIATFTPTSGAVGEAVTITGANLSAATALYFNGVAAVIGTNTATSITTTVPAGASSGPLTVTTAGGMGSSAAVFSVLPAAPTVSSTFTPSSGPVGTSVIVAGTNFSSVTNVKFGAVSATSFTVDSTTRITAKVPVGLAAGNVTVSVTNSNTTGTSSGTFQVLPDSPSITGFTPNSGYVTSASPALTGTAVTISGLSLSTATAAAINGTPLASFAKVGDTTITGVVAAGTTSGVISVTSPSGTAYSTSIFSIVPAPPTISSFSPSSVSYGDTVSISGTFLANATGVRFNGSAAAAFTVVTSTLVTAVLPVGATTGKVEVTTPGGTALSATNLSVLSPTISSFTPTSAKVGDLITLTGTSFTGSTSVTLNGAAMGLVGVTATSITVAVPTGASSGQIAVTSAAGTGTTSALTPASLTVVPAPTVATVSPSSAKPGVTVTVTGTGFGTGATSWVSRVSLNGSPVPATYDTSSAGTRLTFTVPAGGMTGLVSVSNLAGSALSPTVLTVLAPDPTITAFTPASGYVGQSVTISGSNLTGVTAVTFLGSLGRLGAVITANTATAVTVAVPYGAVTGTVEVTTGNGGGTVVSADPFVVTASPPSSSGLSISNISPASGPVGTLVTLTGTGFGGVVVESGVTINGLPLGAVTVNETGNTITGYIPEGAADGQVRVVVGSDTSSSVVFNVVIPPTLTAFSPVTASPGGTLTVTGTHFTMGSSVKFTSTLAGTQTAATTFRVLSDTEISVVVPSDAATGPITVVNEDGSADSSSDLTITHPLPTVTAVSATAVNVGDQMSVTGTYLAGFTSVTFNNVPAIAQASADGTSVLLFVPTGATTGTIKVTTAGGVAESAAITVIGTSSSGTVVKPRLKATLKRGKTYSFLARTPTYILTRVQAKGACTLLVAKRAGRPYRYTIKAKTRRGACVITIYQVGTSRYQWTTSVT